MRIRSVGVRLRGPGKEADEKLYNISVFIISFINEEIADTYYDLILPYLI